MHNIDALIVLAFIAYSITVGLKHRRQASQNLEEYFLAGRTLPGWKAGLSMAATQFAADTPLLVTGIIATAIKKGVANEESIIAAVESMATLNKGAANALNGLNVHAVTDVTGFGLLGHLKEMCQGSDVSAKIKFSELSFLPNVRQLAETGIMAGGTVRNLDYVKDFVKFDSTLSDIEKLLVADAQTSGGLLISINKNQNGSIPLQTEFKTYI
mgnify:CR=1 FL=1